jgi:hypothetical protein
MLLLNSMYRDFVRRATVRHQSEKPDFRVRRGGLQLAYRYTFIGDVYPQRAYFHVNGPILNSEFEWSDAGIKGKLVVTIHSNQIVAWFESQSALLDIPTARNQIQGTITAAVDAVALELATAYNVELIFYIDHSSGENGIFSVNMSQVREVVTPEDYVRDMRVANTASREPLYQRAIADYRQSILQAADTGFLCYRAIESLVHYFAEQNGIDNRKDKPKAVNLLNAALNVDPACIEFLRDKAGSVRHGKVEFISGPDRVCANRTTRSILLRFSAWYQDPASKWPESIKLDSDANTT